MLKKGSTLNSILTGSCPKCQEESMYVVKKPLFAEDFIQNEQDV